MRRTESWVRELKVGIVVLAVLMISAMFALGAKKMTPVRGAETHSVTVAPTELATQPHPGPRYGDIPLSFEANEGQTDPSVRFVSQGSGYTLFLTANEAVLSLQQPDQTDDLALQKMKPTKRKLFESRKFYRGSARSRKARKKTTIRVAMEGANRDSTIEPLDVLPGKTNYFIGSDPQKWQTGIPTFQRVKYSTIYPGIDLIYYGKQRQLEFDFVVAPGADPHAIGLKLQTDGRVTIEKSGNLRVETDGESFELRRPEIYQMVGDMRRLVAGRFVRRGNHRVGFQIGTYDHRRELIIDPALAYSTYLGGNGTDDGFGVAVDANGNAYVVGQTTSPNFPISSGYSSTSNSTGIAFVSKLNSTGTVLLYSTYLGGTGGESGNGIALDLAGNVYVTGYTTSSDFPIVNGFQTSTGTTDANAFVARIDTTQSGTASLIYSTYLGGGGNSSNPIGDVGYAIAVDASGLAYVTGQTTSDASVAPFPTTASAYQASLVSPSGSAFLAVLDTNQTGAASMVYSTYLGGSSTGFGDYGLGVAVDSSGDAYLIGAATSGSPTPFPTTPSAFQGSLNSADGNAFVTEIATTQSGASSLVYSTYLGGSGDGSGDADVALAIALDSSGKVYVTGAASSSDFPITAGAYQTTNPNHDRSFVSKFDLSQSGTMSLSYSTFLGGSNGDDGRGITVDADGNAYVGGGTSSSDFPTTTGAFQTALNSSSSDGFITELNPTATGLVYSSYFGGSCTSGDVVNAISLDSNGNPYLAGSTCSTDFPTYPSGAYQTSLGGTQNAFVAKFALVANPAITPSVSPTPNSSGWNNSSVTVTFTCLPGGAPIETCTSPVTVSTEGADQSVAGNAVDTGANSVSATTTVNLDLTPPTVSITSPTNGATVSTPYVNVSGSITDALSGVGDVLCNGGPATVSGSSFSCNVLLNSVSNSIAVTGSDLAGNTASATVNVSVSITAPSSLQITPGPATMLVGSNQTFAAVDQTGTRRPEASWSVSDTSITTLAADGSGTLAGVATGQATLTATIGAVSAQTQVTVGAGSSLVPGSVLWSAPEVTGYASQKIVQAVPTANGPAIYSIETDSSSDVLVRAFTSDGRQLWQSNVSQIYGAEPYSATGDNSGGLLIAGNNWSFASTMVSLNAVTGGQNWQYSPTPISGTSTSLTNNVAIGMDGTIYVVENFCSYNQTATGGDQPVTTTTTTACLNGINPNSGALVSQVTLPNSSYTDIVGQHCDIAANTTVGYGAGPMSSPIVAPDGSVYMEMVVSQTTNDTECNTDGETFTSSYSTLIEILKNGSSFQTLNSSSTDSFNPSDVIPDGKGGFLASYQDDANTAITIASTSSGTQAVLSSVSPLSSSPDTSMVLGDYNTAFVTDGTNVVAFNATTIQQDWSYSGTPGAMSLVAATSGGGVALNDSSQGVMQLDSSGNANTPSQGVENDTPYRSNAAVSSLLDSGLGLWFGNANGLDLLVGPAVPYADSIYLMPQGGPQNQHSPVPVPKSIDYNLGVIQLLNGQAIIVNGYTIVPAPTYGYLYVATGTVLDKNKKPIQNQALNAYETVQTVSAFPPNPQTPAPNRGVSVSKSGTFTDAVAFFFAEPPPPEPGMFWKQKQFLTITTKTQSYNNLRINCVDKEYDHAKVSDTTSMPNATCQ